MAESNEKDQTLSETFTDSETARKLFVGGLSWQTTEDGLSRYLGSLGVEVERALIMRDKLTGRSRGFGFVIVKHQDMLDKAVSTTLQLDGRKIEAKRAIPKRDMEKLSKKLFVGGIPISLTQADFRKFFETFGTVAEAQVMTERESGRSRGFGFVTFHEDEAVEKVLAKTHSIQGKPVEVKRAEPKKVERTRPIILPVPAYFPTPAGYSAYPMYASPAMYGQALAYDPSGYFVAQPVYAPQFVPVEDPAAATTSSYDQQQQQQQQFVYYDPSAGSPSASSASSNSSNSSSNSMNNGTSSSSPNSDNSSNKAPSDSNSGTNSKKPSRREVNTKSNERWNSTEPSNSSLSLVDRVRVAQNEVRKRNGISDPVTERTKRFSSPVAGTPQIPTSRRTMATMASGSWRRTPATTTGTSTTTSTTTTTTTSTTKEGGSLHKYFQ